MKRRQRKDIVQLALKRTDKTPGQLVIGEVAEQDLNMADATYKMVDAVPCNV